MEVTFIHLTARGQPGLFHQYLALKYQVLVVGQGWKLESNHRRKKVEVTLEDISSVFVVAVNRDGRVLGGVKATMPSHNFPDQGVFGHHLGYQGMERTREAVSVIRGLVVDPEIRGRKFLLDGKETTIASGIFTHLMHVMSEQGAKIGFCSVQAVEAAAIALKHDFLIVDEPVQKKGVPGKWLMNFAWTNDKEAKRYFRSRERVLTRASQQLAYIGQFLQASDALQKRKRASVG